MADPCLLTCPDFAGDEFDDTVNDLIERWKPTRVEAERSMGEEQGKLKVP